MKKLVLIMFGIVFLNWWHAGEVSGGPQSGDLFRLSLEELAEVRITIASKIEKSSFQAPAAVYVINQEDIHRSGLTSIPELLRLVPGMNVARIDANTWAVSIRGFQNRYSNKLLVLIDGRSIYTPLFAGVYWEQQDLVLKDIERIEVIRGPGASVWGSNAVNGVINIITKKAQDTQGGLVSAGGGTKERGFSTIRYGGKMGEKTFYRVYAKYFNRDDFADALGEDANDAWEAVRGGFRLDWDIDKQSDFMLQADYYDGDADKTFDRISLLPPSLVPTPNTVKFSGGHILGRWQRQISEDSDVMVQLYYYRTDWNGVLIGEVRDTLDLEFKHHFLYSDRHDIVWGLNYRLTSDDLENKEKTIFDPDSRTDHLVSFFLQDEVTLIDKLLTLTMGSKFEHNDYSGFEFQPSVRMAWTPDEKKLIWASVSRAVRVPSRVEHDLLIDADVISGPDGTPIIGRASKNDEFDSEDLLAYELGYRVMPNSKVNLDIALFYNDYENLLSLESGEPFLETSPFPPHLVAPLIFDNKADGETYGLEFSANWQVMERWKLVAAYTYFKSDFDLEPSSTSDIELAEIIGFDVQHQFHMRSFLNLPYRLELDTLIYYVDDLSDGEVPAYVRLDMRLSWHPTENLEISFVFQNLVEEEHFEWSNVAAVDTRASQVERGYYGKVTYSF